VTSEKRCPAVSAFGNAAAGSGVIAAASECCCPVEAGVSANAVFATGMDDEE
jgi:hypothetical protein